MSTADITPKELEEAVEHIKALIYRSIDGWPGDDDIRETTEQAIVAFLRVRTSRK